MKIEKRGLLGKAATTWHCHICGKLADRGDTQYYSGSKREYVDLIDSDGHTWSVDIRCEKCGDVPVYQRVGNTPMLRCCNHVWIMPAFPTDNPFIVEFDI